MPTRRNILRGGLGLSLTPLLRSAAQAASGRPNINIENVWIDSSLEAGRAFGDRAAKLGGNIIDASKDATPGLMRQLDLEWRDAPVALAGVTAHGPMFTLEMLARRHGMRLAYAARMMRWEDGTVGVDITSASALCDATPAPGMSDASWAIEMANFTLTQPLEDFKGNSQQVTRQIGERYAGSYDDPLYVWAIVPVAGAARYIAPSAPLTS